MSSAYDLKSLLFLASPELCVVLTICMVLIFNVLCSNNSGDFYGNHHDEIDCSGGVCGLRHKWRGHSAIAIMGLFAAIVHILTFQFGPMERYGYYGEVFMLNDITKVAKCTLMILCVLILLIYSGIIENKYSWRERQAEYVVLVLFVLLGTMVSISARSFLMLYIAFEMIALGSYALAAYDINLRISSEAGVKYFVLGGLASCIMLFGLSYMYGFAHGFEYRKVAEILVFATQPDEVAYGLLFGLVLFFIGIFFKLSMVPFHFWTPDVYEGSPMISVAFFASVPKFGVLLAVVGILGALTSDYSHPGDSIKELISVSYVYILDIIKLLGFIGVVVGAFGAVRQVSLKRLIGYSTVMNVGFAVLGLGSDNYSAVLYQLVYAISCIGLLSSVLWAFGSIEDIKISDMKGMGKVSKQAAFAISFFLISIIGIPPFMGFVAKFSILARLVEYNEIALAVIVLFISVVSAYYYLRIIKTMYFETADNVSPMASHGTIVLPVVSTVCGILLMFSGVLWVQH